MRFSRMKKIIGVLLMVFFVVSLTASAVSAREDTRHWKNDGYYYYDGHNWLGHYDDHGNFWHKHGHYNGKGEDRHWNNHWHRFNQEHGYEKWDKYH